MKLELVMLAAGNSRRFGSNKLLYTVDGQPMYRHILSELEKIQKTTGITRYTVFHHRCHPV